MVEAVVGTKVCEVVGSLVEARKRSTAKADELVGGGEYGLVELVP